MFLKFCSDWCEEKNGPDVRPKNRSQDWEDRRCSTSILQWRRGALKSQNGRMPKHFWDIFGIMHLIIFAFNHFLLTLVKPFSATGDWNDFSHDTKNSSIFVLPWVTPSQFFARPKWKTNLFYSGCTSYSNQKAYCNLCWTNTYCNL